MSTVARPTSRRGAPAPKGSAPAASSDTPPSAESGEAEGEGAESEDELEPDAPANDAPPAAAPAAPAPPATDAVAIAKNERLRVLAIQKLGRPGEEKIIAACIDDPSCTPEAAAFKLRNAEASGPAGYLAALAGDEKEAPAPAAAGAVSEELSSVEAAADAIVNAGKPAKPSASR